MCHQRRTTSTELGYDFIESNQLIHLHHHPESQGILSEVVASTVRCLKPFSTQQFLQKRSRELSMSLDRRFSAATV